MPDMEKVMRGLECCCTHIVGMSCGNCPYEIEQREDEGISDCTSVLAYDALAMLKEQTKTKVVFGRTKDGEFVTECGNCGTHLDKAYSNCPKCKKELDWNSNQT